MMFLNISSEVTKGAIEAANKIIMRKYPFCGKYISWDILNSDLYKNCTREIGASDPQIFAVINEIEILAKHTEYSANDLWLSLEGIEDPEERAESQKLETAINEIKQLSTNLTATTPCQGVCLKTMRDIIIQLKLIQWGYYGPAEASAGLYVAYHRSRIGSYFTSSLGNKWPYYPLHSEPNDVEIQLNEYLMQVTENMSNGIFRRTSMLDLPGFGSRISSLDSFQTSEANWPQELNFAIHSSKKNPSAFFSHYKKLKYLWEKYMDHRIDDNKNGSYYTKFASTLIPNASNFTQYIYDDFQTFIRVYIGSFPTARKERLSIWKDLSKAIFNETLDPSFVERHGLYDKAVMDCSFNENMLKKSAKSPKSLGGCDYLYHTLTNKGLCFSFNALGQAKKIWKPSKVIRAFDHITEGNHVDHQFNGANEGNLVQVFCHHFYF